MTETSPQIYTSYNITWGISWKWTENNFFWLEDLSVLCLKVSIYQFCRLGLRTIKNGWIKIWLVMTFN
jgi:hypothetical protein